MIIEGSGAGPDPCLWLVDPDPGGPKTCGSGSGTQLKNNLMMQVNQPTRSLRAHGDKVSIVKFSPTAVDVVATAAFDWTVKIWNLDTAEVSLSRSPSWSSALRRWMLSPPPPLTGQSKYGTSTLLRWDALSDFPVLHNTRVVDLRPRIPYLDF